MAHVRAVGLTEFGEPDVLHVLDLPQPEAGPGELRIRVHAAAVNPTDTLRRNGARAAELKDVPMPHVPGMDAAGVLEEIGEGVVTDLKIGDHVMAIVVPNGAHGAYAEQIVVPAESAARVPAGAAGATAVGKPVEIGVRPAPEHPAPRPPTRLLPPIRSLHVGESQTVTLRDGRRLFLGAPLGNGFHLSAITSDSVVLRDENGRREEIRVADDVVAANEDTDGPSGEEP